MFQSRNRKRVTKVFEKPSLTKQAFKDECDINNILQKYQKTQLLTHVTKVQGQYGDFSNVLDYQSALNAVIDANDRFQGLPAKVRDRFQNDPTQLIKFVTDESNRDEAINLGLIPKPKKQTTEKDAPTQKTKNDELNDDKKSSDNSASKG